MTGWKGFFGRWLLVLTAIFGAGSAGAVCAPHCAVTGSVTTMAGGFPPKVMSASDDISFVGSKLPPQGIKAVRRLAQEALQFTAGMQSKQWRLRVHVQADPGLSGKAANKQVTGRKLSLTRALVAAGIKKSNINFVSVAPRR